MIKLRTDGKKLRTENKKIQIESSIVDSEYNKKIKNNLEKIYIACGQTICSPKDIIGLLDVSPNTATSYINKLLNLNLLDKVEGVVQSKYRFKR